MPYQPLDKKQIIPHEQNQQIAKDKEVLSTFANVDFQRTRFWCLTAAVAVDVTRRLGPDASSKELWDDKRLSRKVCHAYHMLWSLFSKETEAPPPPAWSDWPITHNDPVMIRIGRTVIWDQQVNYLINVVVRRMWRLTELEELARTDGVNKWYNKHAMLLDWEHEALWRVKNFMEQGSATRSN